MTERKNNPSGWKIWRWLLIIVGGYYFLLWLGMGRIPVGSPKKMVEAQIVHGEKIVPANPAPAMPAPATNSVSAIAVLSNAVAVSALTNPASPGFVPPRLGQFVPKTFTVGNVSVTLRPKPAAADSNSLPDVIEQAGHKYLNVTFARLAAFPFKVTPEVADATDDPGLSSRHTREQVPASVQALTEKSAAVTGFMLPVRVENGLTSDFLLLRNQSACCYGIMPRINEWVVVHASGKGVKPVMDVPITALGTFHVGEMRENGRLVGIYLLDCDQLLLQK